MFLPQLRLQLQLQLQLQLERRSVVRNGELELQLACAFDQRLRCVLERGPI